MSKGLGMDMAIPPTIIMMRTLEQVLVQDHIRSRFPTTRLLRISTRPIPLTTTTNTHRRRLRRRTFLRINDHPLHPMDHHRNRPTTNSRRRSTSSRSTDRRLQWKIGGFIRPPFPSATVNSLIEKERVAAVGLCWSLSTLPFF